MWVSLIQPAKGLNSKADVSLKKKKLHPWLQRQSCPGGSSLLPALRISDPPNQPSQMCKSVPCDKSLSLALSPDTRVILYNTYYIIHII